jgi:hypothetical protein
MENVAIYGLSFNGLGLLLQHIALHKKKLCFFTQLTLNFLGIQLLPKPVNASQY